MARPSSASNASRLATSTTLIPDAAICRVNSLPIPDEAPVTSAHGPNCPLSSAAFIVLFLSVDGTCCSIVRSHSVPIQSFRRFTSITTKSDERVPKSLSARSIWVFHTFSPTATQESSFLMVPSPVNHSLSFLRFMLRAPNGRRATSGYSRRYPRRRSCKDHVIHTRDAPSH